MIAHFLTYFWKNGKPYGLSPVTPTEAPISYKIIVDPYYKRFSIEKYRFALFDKIVYDSYLLDFRHLKPLYQTAWQKEELYSDDSSIICLMRNQDDRAILKETHYFEKNRPRICKMSSIHGIFLSTHRILYDDFGDPYNGVILYDSEERPVMIKKYSMDPLTYEFTDLIEEKWDMQGEVQFGHSQV